VKTASGVKTLPRLNRQVGSPRRRTKNDPSVANRTTSNGLIDKESAMKKADSWLDMFFVNGHHGVVTMSPTSVRKTSEYSPTTGRRNDATQTTTSTAKTIENSSGAEATAINATTMAKRTTAA
jgi:hypothetical protein